MRKPQWHRPHHARQEYLPARGPSVATAGRRETLREGTSCQMILPLAEGRTRGKINVRGESVRSAAFPSGLSLRVEDRPSLLSPRAEDEKHGLPSTWLRPGTPPSRTHIPTIVFGSNFISLIRGKNLKPEGHSRSISLSPAAASDVSRGSCNSAEHGTMLAVAASFQRSCLSGVPGATGPMVFEFVFIDCNSTA